MKLLKALAVSLVCAVASVTAQSASAPTLLDRMVGRWVMRGTIEGKPATHDLDAEWVLNHGYIRMHEVSHEKDAAGAPAYEAIIFISADPKTGEDTVLWLDTTSNAGLVPDGFGRGMPTATTVPFVFRPKGSEFHNTFIYDPAADRWRWELDDVTNGAAKPFARLTLTKRR